MPIDPLAEALTETARRAFTRVREMHPDESFYSFALLSSSDVASFIQPTCSGERGLAKVSADYVARGDSAADLRWNPYDSPYFDLTHELAAEQIAEIESILAERPDPYDLYGSDDEAGDREVAARFEACFRALSALDEEGFFGTGAERDRVVVNVLTGDQSDRSILENAARLNPPAVVERLATELQVPEPVGDPVTLGSVRACQIDALAYAPDAGVLVAAGSGGELYAWDLRGGTELLATRDVRHHWRAAISRDGALLVVTEGGAGEQGPVTSVELPAGTRHRLFDAGYSALAVSPDGTMVVCDDRDALSAMRVTIRPGEPPHTRPAWRLDRPAHQLRFSPDGRLLAVAGSGIVLVDSADGMVRHEMIPHALGTFHCLAWSAEGRALATGDWRGTGRIRLWHWEEDGPAPAAELTPPMDDPAGHGTNDLAFSADGTLLASAHGNGEIHVWNVETGDHLRMLRGRQEDIDSIVFVEGDRLAAAGRDVDQGPPVYLWPVPSGR